MRFANPLLLIWAALLAVPIVLYLFRPKPRTVLVSTLAFFKSLVRAHQEAPWLRRLKQLVSFLLTAAVILFVTAALGRLIVAPPAEALKTVVLLVDRSASMAARDEHGRTRLDDALAGLRERLAGLPAGAGACVIAFDRRPEILLSRTLDERAVRRALDSIRVRPIEGNTRRALDLAGRLAALETPAAVWLASDAPPSPIASTPDKHVAKRSPTSPRLGRRLSVPARVTVEYIPATMASGANVGITALSLRPAPGQVSRHDAFIQLHASVIRPTPVELEISVDGRLLEIRKLTLKPKGRERLLVPIESDRTRARLLEVKIKAAGDVLPADDVAYARIPKLRPIKVLWISASRDPFTELALLSMGEGHDVLVGPPSSWPPKQAMDVAIFDNWLPRQWPRNLPAIVINPPRSVGPIRTVALKAPLPIDHVRAVEPQHALLYGVASARVRLQQTMVVDALDMLEPLWVGPKSEPLLLAGQVAGRRLVLLAFEPQQSENLPLMASYPLLIGNAVSWAAEPQMPAITGRNYRTGELVDVGAKSISWSDGSPRGKNVEVPVAGKWTELDRVGAWRGGGVSGAASLLSPAETRIVTKSSSTAAPTVAAARLGILRGELSWLLIWIVLAVLLIESWLFHRHAVY